MKPLEQAVTRLIKEINRPRKCCGKLKSARNKITRIRVVIKRELRNPESIYEKKDLDRLTELLDDLEEQI